MRVTLGTPIEKLSDKQKATWLPKMFKKGLGFIGSQFIQPDDLDWRPADAGIVIYIRPEALTARLAVCLPSPSLSLWALTYISGENDALPAANSISMEQPLEEVAYATSYLAANLNGHCLAAADCANRLAGLWQAGLIQFTIPVRFPPQK